MTFYLWIQLALVCLLGAMSPGPSLALIIHNTVNKNRFNGIITSIGHGLGVSIYALLAVLGLGFLIETHKYIFIGLKIAGSVFLFFLGMYFVVTAKNNKNKNFKKEKIISTNSFLQGFFLAFLNPKILVFFIALFSQFISSNATNVEKIILVSTSGIIDIVWYIFISICITLYSIKEFIDSNKIKIERVMGFLLIIISLTIIYKFI